MSYQCLVASNIAKTIKRKNLGLSCNKSCDNLYSLILFDFIEDTSSIDCSDTDYDDEYIYDIPSNILPSQDEIDNANAGQDGETIDCTDFEIEILGATSLEQCSNDILIEFIDDSGIVSDNPNNNPDMASSYYSITNFSGERELELRQKALVSAIVFIPLANSTIKVGTTSGDDDVVFEDTILLSNGIYSYTVDRFFEDTTLYIYSSVLIKEVRVYVQ